MARDQFDPTPIENRAELVAWFEAGCKPQTAFRIGTEHEKIPYRTGTTDPVVYKGPNGIEALLRALEEQSGWDAIMDGDAIIGLADPNGGGAISLEPGGQFELSGAPLKTLHEGAQELDQHLETVKHLGRKLGISFLTIGASPVWSRSETPVMPKARYGIMSSYMPKVGTMGLDMMYRTTTVQVNLDFSSEADMVLKMQVSLALQSLATALFANSPVLDGIHTGFSSTRGEIWRHTDPHRTGLLPFAFEAGMGFERYVDWALDVPMYFVKRGDVYHDVAGASFRDLMAGRLTALPGERATLSDWANHLSTLFPDVRLKRYIEMRGADAGAPDMLKALPAFWVGLLYDPATLAALSDLTRSWTQKDRQDLRDAVPAKGLSATIQGRRLQDVARDVLSLAIQGLKARGLGEEIYLSPLDEIVVTGQNRAEGLLQRYGMDWRTKSAQIFAEQSF
jgi:glutamate--cysteine ligase